MRRPAKLRFLATRYPHWGAYSGIGQFTRHLAPKDFAVRYRLVADDDSELPLPGVRLRERVRARIQQSGMGWYKLSDLAAELKSFGSCAVGQTDLVHFLDGEHSAQFLPGWLDRWAMDGIPVVASYHQPPDMLPELVDPAVVSRLDAVVLVAPSQVEFFRPFLPEDRIVTILHGIDTDFFRPGERRAPSPLRCVTAGHWLRDWDAIRIAAERLASNRSVEFHLVTGRDTGLSGLPNVVIHQGLSDAELLALYQSCHIGFLPLIDSTANNSLLEMIACGLPVLSTDMEAVRAYVGEDAAILLPPEERGNYADIILELLADKDRRDKLGNGARKRALDLAWPRIAPHYAELYARLLGMERRG